MKLISYSFDISRAEAGLPPSLISEAAFSKKLKIYEAHKPPDRQIIEKLVEVIAAWHSAWGSPHQVGCLKFRCQYVAIPLTTLYTSHHLGFVNVGAYQPFWDLLGFPEGLAWVLQTAPVSAEAANLHLGLQGPLILMEKATIKTSSQKLNLDKLKWEIIHTFWVTVINC